MSKNKKKKKNADEFIFCKVKITKDRLEEMKKLSLFMDFGPIADKESADTFIEILINERLCEFESDLFNAKFNKKKRDGVEEEFKKLIAFAEENGLYDPSMKLMDEPELLKLQIILKSTLKNSSFERLCNEYIKLYDDVDLKGFMKDMAHNVKPKENIETLPVTNEEETSKQ